MNWIDEKFSSEESLKDQAPQLWQQVRSAIQDSCASYNLRYEKSPETNANCTIENGKRVRVQKKIRKVQGPGYLDDLTVLVAEFKDNPPRISVTGDDPVKTLELEIVASPLGVVIAPAINPTSPDAFAKLALESLLFPTGNYRDVR